MKNPERVAQLLAELRELADNDFELHRIDVLERDLTAPPVVEQIDDKHQRFDGETYTKISSGHYRMLIPIHRAVWTYYYGNLPDKHLIHHVDLNPGNNDVENLAEMSVGAHTTLHKKILTQTTHSQNNNGVTKTCPHCGKTFQAASNTAKFCSQECAANEYWKTRQGKLINVSLTCKQCGKEYPALEGGHGQFCTEKCRRRYQYEQSREQRICIVCGKTFETYKYSKQTVCSHQCAGKRSAICRHANNVLK